MEMTAPTMARRRVARSTGALTLAVAVAAHALLLRPPAATAEGGGGAGLGGLAEASPGAGK